MAYGSYMPAKANIGKTVLVVVVLDTLCALTAGLIIFLWCFLMGWSQVRAQVFCSKLCLWPLRLCQAGSMSVRFLCLGADSGLDFGHFDGRAYIGLASRKGLGRVRATLLVCGVAWFWGWRLFCRSTHWSEVKVLGARCLIISTSSLPAC